MEKAKRLRMEKNIKRLKMEKKSRMLR